jgi:NADP-dependent 3-hydroxy acid dehydrogenase YdfG
MASEIEVASDISIGIGLMMAKALEENGAKVYIVGRRMELLEKVSKEAVSALYGCE